MVVAEAGVAILAAGSLVAAADATSTIILAHMIDVGPVFLRGGGRMINTNATVARTMLNHLGRSGEGTAVAHGLGHGFGFGDYLKAITPGVNVYYGLKDAKEACR